MLQPFERESWIRRGEDFALSVRGMQPRCCGKNGVTTLSKIRAEKQMAATEGALGSGLAAAALENAQVRLSETKAQVRAATSRCRLSC
jgi:hypothetical protein